tara:strand:+ start:210 stop:377 length:168 start_codon:yes stop_codon:yes gene_type:complete
MEKDIKNYFKEHAHLLTEEFEEEDFDEDQWEIDIENEIAEEEEYLRNLNLNQGEE